MPAQNQAITRQIVNVVVFIFTLVMNTLAVALPLNGRSTEAISEALPSYFTPAGFTFSIWSLIYLTLIGFVIYQALPSQRYNPDLERIGYLPAVANLLNGVWIVTWHYGYYGLSVVVMLGLLTSLLAIYIQLRVGLPTTEARPRSWPDKLFILLPFSLYFAWINVATVANIASVVGYTGWNGLGISEPGWSVIMIVVVAIIGCALLINRANAAYAAVLIWALIGISASQPAPISTAALTAAVAIVLAAAVGWYRHWSRPQDSNPAAASLT